MTRAGGALTLAAVEADVRRRFLGGDLCARAPGVTTLGIEAEYLPGSASGARILPIEGTEPSTATILRLAAGEAGWREDRSRGGAPTFQLEDGARFSFEPGGQLEYSSAVHVTAETLLRAGEDALAKVRRHTADRGAVLHALGIDPVRSLEDAPLLLHEQRYLRMDEYFRRIGPFGARMMRQTAALQINIAAGPDPISRWRLLGAAVPFLLALFANSRVYAGRPTRHASFRAHVWRQADESRTGLPALGPDPVMEYAAFALDAPLMLHPEPDGTCRSARDWLERGELGAAIWETHCTTLFPEVRPKGYFELRSLDACEPDSVAAAIILVAGLAFHPPAAREAAALLPRPDPAILRCAGELGLGDPGIAGTAAELAEIALRGAAALGPGWLASHRLESARALLDERLRVRGGGGITIASRRTAAAAAAL